MTGFFSEIYEFFFGIFGGIIDPIMTDFSLKIHYFLAPFLMSIAATLIVEFFRILITQVKK
mgnify:CR=1 FL=1